MVSITSAGLQVADGPGAVERLQAAKTLAGRLSGILKDVGAHSLLLVAARGTAWQVLPRRCIRRRGGSERGGCAAVAAPDGSDFRLEVPLLDTRQQLHPAEDLWQRGGQREPVRQVMITAWTRLEFEPSLLQGPSVPLIQR